jgi:hypothetical protein
VVWVAIKIKVVDDIDQQQCGLMFVPVHGRADRYFFRHEPFRKGQGLVRKVPNMPPKKATIPEGDRERSSAFGYSPVSPRAERAFRFLYSWGGSSASFRSTLTAYLSGLIGDPNSLA